MFKRLDEWLIGWLFGGRIVFASAFIAIAAAMPIGCVKTSAPTERPAVASSLSSTIEASSRPQLKALYSAAARAVAYDGTVSAPRLRSTLDVAEYVQRLNGYRWAGTNRLATDAFSASLDSRWVAAFGKSDAVLTEQLRADAVKLLQGVADDL